MSYNATDNLQYDSNGNITSRICGSNVITYKYDGLDRLIRENNQYLGKTFKFQYDVNGNILSVKTCNYTTASEETNLVTASYSYDSSKRLNKISYTSGASVNFGEYDSLGNPRNYKGNNLVWTRGRMLKQYGTKASYLYDANGIRQEKTVSGTMHSYYADGDKIIAEKVGENTREYYYDASGIVGIKYNGNTYYLQKNIHGDVERIFDTNGSLAGSYKYDAWGNHKTYKRINGTDIDITENMGYNSDILKVNPFRYRGYYYDVETGLYYTPGRYYDPEVGRWINADDIELSMLQLPEIGALNLYSYCLNNPVMNIDPTGGFVLTTFLVTILIGAAIGAAVGGGFEIGRQLIFEGGVNDWGKVGWAVLGGAVAGAITAIPITGAGFLSWAGTFALGAAGSLASGAITGAVDFSNPWSVALAIGIGGFANVAARGISNAILGSKASSVFNQGSKAKSLAVQQLQGHARNMGSQALKGSMRNTFKDTSLATIKGLLTNANPFIRYGIYASINSAAMSSFPYIFM